MRKTLPVPEVTLIVLGLAILSFGFAPVGTLLRIVAVAVGLVAVAIGGVSLRRSGIGPLQRIANTLWRLGVGGGRLAEVPATEQRMGEHALRFIVLYLVAILAVGSVTIASVWVAEVDAPEVSLTATSVDAPLQDADDAGPLRVDSLLPATVTFGVGDGLVYVVGSGFSSASVVRVNGEVHRGGRVVNGALMVLELNESDFSTSGSRFVDVSTPGGQPSNPLVLRVQSGSEVRVLWTPLFRGEPRPLTIESRLFLLAVLVGLVGGALAGLNSLGSYRGDGKLTRSWFLFFFVGPVLSAGVSGLLYVSVRAGLLAGTNVTFDASSTPWGLLAISGLAGLFYDKTLLKLREVYVALFSPRDDRGGKVEAPRTEDFAITTDALPPATRGRVYRANLVATGGVPEHSWSVEPALPPGLQLDPLNGRIEGTPTEVAASRIYTFTVRDLTRRSRQTAIEFEVRP